jgi:hypothetical protein
VLITPLDPVLGRAGIAHDRGLAVGFRVARAIDHRFTVEFSMDSSLPQVRLTDDARTGIEATSSSFERAFRSLAFVSLAESKATMQVKGGTRLSANGALNFKLLTNGRLMPYVTVGAGILSTRGALPSATLVGRYRIPLDQGGAVDNTDAVTIRYEEKTSPILVLGGGVKFDVRRRSGIRGDLRFSIRSNHDVIVVDAQPSSAGATLGAFPGPAVRGFQTFNGTGLNVHAAATVGYFTRF